MSQHQKIYEFAKDLDWHCQSEFWAVSHSPHKRRAEMSQNPIHAKDYKAKHEIFGIWEFEPRPCGHGIDGAKDYRIVVAREKPESYPLPSDFIRPKIRLTRQMKERNIAMINEAVAKINETYPFKAERSEVKGGLFS